MKLIFPGTKGEIEEENSKHKYHSSIVILCGTESIIIDFGVKHAEEIYKKINDFDGLLITHAHPDHYVWTKKAEPGITVPVYLTEISLNYSLNRPLNPVIIMPGISFKIKTFEITPYNVIHSLRCPAVCYKIRASVGGGVSKNIIYAPDILDTALPKEKIFKGTDIFIGDGSSFDINLVRRKGDNLFGHAMIKTIVNWCLKYEIPELMITHCGKQIVSQDEEQFISKVQEIAGTRLSFKIAYDGLEIEV